MQTNKIAKLLTVIGLASMLTSCVVGKKYTRPDAGLPASYRNEVSITADTIVLPWKTFFKDPQLVTLIDKALTKNNEVVIALKTMDQLELARRQARLALLPVIEGTGGATRNYPSKNSLNGSLTEQFTGTKYIDDFSAGLAISWEADIWGKSKMQQQQARANYFAQKENLSALKTRIISQVAQSYFNLISLDAQLRVARQNVALLDSTLEMIRLQYNAGQATSVAVEQAVAQKKTAELIVPLAMQNMAVQENALSILCGQYPDSIARGSDIGASTPADLFSPGIPAQLLSRRPDVAAAEYTVMSLNAQTGLAKAAMYPTFSLTAQSGVNSYKFNTWFDLPGSFASNLAANLVQPIFQKNALKTAYKTALIEQEKAVVQFRQSVLTAVGEVSDAMARSSRASERLVLVLEKQQALDNASHAALTLYQSGMATYLEVITAQAGKLENDLEAVNIKLEKANAVTDLYRAMGGGVN